MKTLHNNYCNSKQGYLPLFLSDCLDLLDPVLTFDRLMGGIDLNKYLTDIPEYTTGRLRYNPVNMLKTVLFGFMTSGYCSLRELEDNCKVNIRFMYLMDHQTPSYRTFGYFINEILQDKIENIFNDINHAIFNDEHVDLQHLYIDGSKFEANANKYTWVWKKTTEKFRYKLYEKITAEIEEINAEIAWSGVQITTNPEYVPDYLNEIVEQLVLLWELDTSTFVYRSGKRKSKEQRHYEHLTTFCQKLQEYIQKNVLSRELILKEFVDSLRDSYDYILIDCAPSLGMMTINALVAADEVIIPVQAAYLPVKGLQQLMKTINMVKRRLHTKWKILLILYVRVCSPSAPLQ